MNIEQKILLKQFEEFTGSEIEIVYEGILNKFAYYFSRLDIEGVNDCLTEYNKYDGVPKGYYLKLIQKTFNKLKNKDITSLDVETGICNGCIKGCQGFTFVDNDTGAYVDIIIEVKNKEIINFMECHDLKNNSKFKKKERLIIKPFVK